MSRSHNFRIAGKVLRASCHTAVDGKPVVVQVEEISLQNCVLKRWDGARIWYPNTVMLAAPVINMARSACKWESFTVTSLRCLHPT
jgi:small-conductance mechanosensitive channel